MKNVNYRNISTDHFTMTAERVRLNVVRKSITGRAEHCNNSNEKKIFDIIISIIIFILIFSWLFPLIALLIKLTSKGPVFYMQERVGLNGEMLRIYKFRTMKLNAPMLDAEGKFIQSVKNDIRVTRIGSLLRKTSIDELPQFINVLEGKMSIIGPRPHVAHLNDHFEEPIENYEQRILVKPGITGLAQVKGLRGVTHGVNDMRNRVNMDIYYIQNWSFWLDIKIFFVTIYEFLTGDENAY